MQVQLYFHDQVYEIYLGQLVSIYTDHVSKWKVHNKKESAAVNESQTLKGDGFPTLCVSMSPEKHLTEQIVLHESTEFQATACRLPLNWKGTRGSILGLVSLKSFLMRSSQPASDGANPRILVCVKTVGNENTCMYVGPLAQSTYISNTANMQSRRLEALHQRP